MKDSFETVTKGRIKHRPGVLARAITLLALLVPGLAAAGLGQLEQSASAQSCQTSIGPGIPPPAAPIGRDAGFHAAYHGQSGYMTLCPGAWETATVAYLNTGHRGWVRGQEGQTAYLGTWDPTPGQDQASALGGDGGRRSANTGWPRYNRAAEQPALYVGPGQVAWFQFVVQAPTTPGYYRLYLRPLIEGALWMEDYGVFLLVTVLNPDGSAPPAVPVLTPPPVKTPPAPPPTTPPTPTGSGAE